MTETETPQHRYGYICMYRGEKFETHADTTIGARNKAAEHFRKKHKRLKDYDISTYLCEIDGEQVTHTPD